MDHQSGSSGQFPELRARMHTWRAKRSHRRGILDHAAQQYARAAQATRQEATRQAAIDAYWNVQSEAKPVAIQVVEGPCLVRRLPVPPGAFAGEVWGEAARIASSGRPTAVETRGRIAELRANGRLRWRPAIPHELMFETPSFFEDLETEGVA